MKKRQRARNAFSASLLFAFYSPCFSLRSATFCETRFLWSGYQNQRTAARMIKPIAGMRVEREYSPDFTLSARGVPGIFS